MNKNELYNKNINKYSFFNIIEYLFAFLTIIANKSIFAISVGRMGLIIKLCWILILCILSSYSFIKLNNNNLNNLLSLMTFFIPFILLFLIFNYLIFNFAKGFILSIFIIPILLMIYFFYCLQQNVNTPTLFYKFENVMLIIAVISLIFWILSSMGVQPNMSLISKLGTNTNGLLLTQSNPGYFGIYFTSQGSTNFLGFNLMRNSGIFTEAPWYSAMLNITLFIEVFLRSNKKIFNFRTVIIIITLITTTSTNGLLITLLTILCSFYLSLNNSKIKGILVLLLPFVLMIIIVAIKTLISNKYDTGFNSSYALRINDMVSSLIAWKQHFVIGNGLGNDMSIIQHMDQRRLELPYGVGISLGLTTDLAYGGIIYLFIHLLPMILVSKKSERLFMFSICLISLYMLENISVYYIFIIILSYFWVYFIYHKYPGNYYYN